MIREILQSIASANGPTPPTQQAKRAGDPCVICGQPTPNFCGMCVRSGLEQRTAICTFEQGPACQQTHAADKHRDGQVAETDPEWVG